MRQFDDPHILPMHTAFVKNLDVYVISPIMCYSSCRDLMNAYFTTGNRVQLPIILITYRFIYCGLFNL